MEKFKEYEKINEPDIRNTCFVLVNQKTGAERSFTLKDVYEEISSINLSEYVPEDIRSQFNIVKNLYLYTWHCYSFHQVVELKCFSVLENALRQVIADEKINGTFNLIRKGIKTGKIGVDYLKNDMGRSHITEKEHEEYARSFSSFRNTLAHGSSMLYPQSILTVYRCASLINHIFEIEVKDRIEKG